MGKKDDLSDSMGEFRINNIEPTSLVLTLQSGDGDEMVWGISFGTLWALYHQLLLVTMSIPCPVSVCTLCFCYMAQQSLVSSPLSTQVFIVTPCQYILNWAFFYVFPSDAN